MNVYFLRMKEPTQNGNDVIELKWVSRTQVAAPATITQIHEKDQKGQFNQQAGPDSWAVAGSASPPHLLPKAGDLSNFGKITKSQLMTLGPSSAFTGEKVRVESSSRTTSSSNMFSMLSQNPELAAAEATSKAN
ncbi:hypothetical protein PILCRDRAFT_14892 [Piloderma croceum F 1598]|uniref:Uncharacterized protein n=1 Tax=Piloderma croceum (strain F 1598) TaxID=765440 RepID=A0A0C3AJ75_PILCF|nr:hypothetical protein PILCRDRAFT_14892 [Piloderma croceum F 1598]